MISNSIQIKASSMMLINSHNHSDLSANKMQRCQDYIHALEEERRKIQVFQRELPLCLDLVTQAIESCKQQFSGTTTEYNTNGGHSECSEQTSSDAPVLEEFIPIKRSASSHSDREEQESPRKPIEDDDNDTDLSNKDGNNNCNKNDKYSKKSDWLRSVQLWNQTSDPSSKEGSPRKVIVTEVNRNGSGGAFHPFKKDINVATENLQAPPPSNSSIAETGGANKKEEKEGQSQRKTRRCWSPELHRRFLQALQQLGGSHAATPKQIRELMKVDGLTNDEVKSHLQKYRLHTRRPTTTIQGNSSSSTNSATQAPQFVVVGGIWVPPEYAAMSGEGTSNRVYAPIAALSPPPFREASASPKQRQPNSADGGSGEGGAARAGSNSPATSSSTHTTSAAY